MAILQQKTHQSKPKTRHFLSCFGLSLKLYSRKSSETMKSGRRRRIPSFSMFRLKARRSIAAKTVPVEAPAVALKEEDSNFSATPGKSKSKSKTQPLAGGKLLQSPSVLKPDASDQTPDEKDERNWSEHVQKAVLEEGKSPRNSHSLKTSTYQTSKIFGRRIEPVGTKKISCQRSLPVEKNLKSPTTFQPRPEKNLTGDDSSFKRDFDHMIGIFILTLLLLITLIWGKLCAVICTSAWFYMLPRRSSSSELKNMIEERSQNLKITEMNSDSYRKKKVVFDGFLERSRRSRLGIHRHRMADHCQEDEKSN